MFPSFTLTVEPQLGREDADVVWDEVHGADHVGAGRKAWIDGEKGERIQSLHWGEKQSAQSGESGMAAQK